MNKEQKYDLHLGSIIRDRIKANQMTQLSVAMSLNLTRDALKTKLSQPHYGTVYDVIAISQVLGENLFEPIVITLTDNNHIPEYSSRIQKLSEDLLALQDTLRRYEAILDDKYELRKKNKG